MSPEAIAKAIREVCADRSGAIADTVAEIRQLLAHEHADVNMPNRNGKAAIHFTAQLQVYFFVYCLARLGLLTGRKT